MQPMIGRDAVLLLINHRIGSLRNDLRLGNTDQKCVNAMIEVLEDIKGQIDFIMPVHMPTPPKLMVMTADPAEPLGAEIHHLPSRV